MGSPELNNDKPFSSELACKLIPKILQNEPVFINVDDTTVPKFNNKLDAVSLLHDHACHTDKFYVNGTTSLFNVEYPGLCQHEEKAPLICYLAVSVGYQVWTKERAKLELDGNLIEEVVPLLKERQMLLFFDSWYAKDYLIERVLQYPHMTIICNVRNNSVKYKLSPLLNGKPCPPKNEENGFIWTILHCLEIGRTV